MYTVRNKKNGATWECNDEERQRLLDSPMSKNKLIFTRKSTTPTPSEAKKVKKPS